MKHVCLIGAGAQAREITDYCREAGLEVDFLAVGKDYITLNSRPQNIDINAPSDEQKSVYALMAVGPPGLKRQMLQDWPGVNFATLIAKNAWVSGGADIGEGTVIAPNASVAFDTTLGKHVLVNLNSSISHDVSIGNFCTISPGVNIGGTVRLGDGVFVGIGASISNNVNIAAGCIVGAGALVLEDITEENTVVVGVPAKKIKINESWMYEI